jgi:predicted dehydrogenase
MDKKRDLLTRRQFNELSATTGMGVLLSVGGLAAPAGAAPAKKRRYAMVGVGHRSYPYQTAIHTTFGSSSELVGVCDTNPGRLKLAQRFASQSGRPEPPAYAAADFDLMLRQTKPDLVIVTTIDGFHHEYICRAMLQGYDVLTEKPMTTRAEYCQAIVDTALKTKRQCRVAFNYRYTPVRTQIKEILMSGTIGDVLSVDFHWMLDTFHGADYFRRWHSQKALSGGLMIHKATHHFDLVNWWLSAVPVSVTAVGKRDFYTPAMAKRLGLKSHHQRCRTCPEKPSCAFELDLSKDEHLRTLYLDQESFDGYYRDRCVFRPDIDIEDTMNVLVSYHQGTTLCYSVNAFNAWEGCWVVFNGTKGRLEHKHEEAVSLAADTSGPGAVKGEGIYLKVYPMRKPAYQITPAHGTGGHGGGDPLMLADLLGPKQPDKTLRAADYRAGAYSMLIGAAANRCFETGQVVRIADLVRNLKVPDYPRVGGKASPLMPPKTRRP